jgi:adenine-specific DNA-methyltransferase
MFMGEKGLRVPEMKWRAADENWEILEEPAADEVAIWPIDPDKHEKVWTCSPKRAEDEIKDIRFERDSAGHVEIYKKYRPNQEGALPGTWWEDASYSASESGTKVLKDLFGAKDFDYPKSINLVMDCLRVCGLVGHGT